MHLAAPFSNISSLACCTETQHVDSCVPIIFATVTARHGTAWHDMTELAVHCVSYFNRGLTQHFVFLHQQVVYFGFPWWRHSQLLWRWYGATPKDWTIV